MEKKSWNVVGLMSGTSLDGLDIALCQFHLDGEGTFSYGIQKAVTSPYSDEEKGRLSLMGASALDLAEANAWFGHFCGQKVRTFLQENQLSADLVASHGHTVFHQPARSFTMQIGDGASIAAVTGLPVVSDFRTMDVALGGQGAPLVPIGDLLLFQEYVFCLNLGGIANISVKKEGGILAYDVCPANMVLNLIAKQGGMEYDHNGEMAKRGKVDGALLSKLELLEFYRQPSPKSLGKEWVDQVMVPLLQRSELYLEDKMATLCEHIALRISSEVIRYAAQDSRMLVTGGGAFHGYLIEKIKEKIEGVCQVEIPNPELVCFKEALVFAFLGLLRIKNKPNSLRQVTGAGSDSIGGALYGDFSRLLPNF